MKFLLALAVAFGLTLVWQTSVLSEEGSRAALGGEFANMEKKERPASFLSLH